MPRQIWKTPIEPKPITKKTYDEYVQAVKDRKLPEALLKQLIRVEKMERINRMNRLIDKLNKRIHRLQRELE
jgi:uncharacterized Zn finger protein (UPF0148 family)